MPYTEFDILALVRDDQLRPLPQQIGREHTSCRGANGHAAGCLVMANDRRFFLIKWELVDKTRRWRLRTDFYSAKIRLGIKENPEPSTYPTTWPHNVAKQLVKISSSGSYLNKIFIKSSYDLDPLQLIIIIIPGIFAGESGCLLKPISPRTFVRG
jgi:hypothetical protein